MSPQTVAPASAHAQSLSISERSAHVIAGGVVSLNRKVEPQLVFTKAQGSKLTDADGHEYIDYHAAFAPHLLGHNHPVVNDAVKRAMDDNWSLMGSGTTPWELRLAELLTETIASFDTIQVTNTGSEGTAHAIRLSRAHTGRNDIILPVGGYNGWHNEVAREVMAPIAELGPRVSPGEYRFIPLSAGIPEGTRARVHMVNFNDLASVEYVMQRYPIACIMLEPVLQNVGIIPPAPGYLAGLRKLCDQHGVVLVFDEVKTGFRSALGGYQSICGVRPDLSVFGKAIANGYPLGVIGGRHEIMDLFHTPDRAKRVLVAGTYNAHPFNTAAAIATIELLREGQVHPRLETLGARMQAGLEQIFAERGITAVVSRLASAFCVYFGDHIPVDYHDLCATHDFELDKRYRRALVDRGIYHFPLPCKQGSISFSHSDEDIARTLEITAEVVKAL